MTEENIITDDDLDTVDEVYSAILETNEPSDLAGMERIVYLIENYNQEINSGLDFIQWFRWAEPFQLKETPGALKSVGLTDSDEICSKALQMSFPEGLPSSYDEKDAALDGLEDDDDKEDTREALLTLAQKQEDQNYQLTTQLAAWIRANK